MAKLKDSLKNRAKQLQQRCRTDSDYKSVFTAKDHELSHILVNLEHKFLYCGLPQAGELDWRRVFYKLSGKTSETNLKLIPADKLLDDKNFLLFSQLTNDTKNEVIREYKKFIIIRNPFERILAIYQHIFIVNDHSKAIKAKWAEAINENIKKNKTKSKDISFGEFLDFVLLINSKNASKELTYFVNQKFHSSMHDLCFPCNIQYNLIGDFNDLVDDSNYVLKTIGASFSFTFSESRRWFFPGRYFSQVEKDVLLKVTSHYIADMTLFGYSGVNVNQDDNY
jgi:hypothetical protein